MQFTTKAIQPIQSEYSVHIDWSSSFSRAHSTPENIEYALRWIKQYPNTNDIHIRLPANSTNQLKRSLLALGCKITTKVVVH